MAHYAVLLLLNVAATTPPDTRAVDFATGDGTACLLGYCSLPTREGPPPGLMFLSVGLVGVGLAGLWQRRGRSGSSE
jgi:MYXO-CTERM domain-containing protein